MVKKKFKQFVQNRVTTIQSLWNKEYWVCCPPELSPRDIASRGVKSSDLVSNDLWWKGAPFLEMDQWPNTLNCLIGEDTISKKLQRN